MYVIEVYPGVYLRGDNTRTETWRYAIWRSRSEANKRALRCFPTAKLVEVKEDLDGVLYLGHSIVPQDEHD